MCCVDLGGEEPGGKLTLILREAPDFWAPSSFGLESGVEMHFSLLFPQQMLNGG